MVEFLIDNIFVKFGGCVFHQVIGIPIGTNCVALPGDLFLYSYESELLDNMVRSGHRNLARSFSMRYRCMDDLIVFNNKKFGDYVKEIYPSQLTVKKPNTSDDLANYLDLSFIIGSNNRLYTKLYDKRDDLDFHIVNYPSLSSNISSSPSFRVYISQLIRYARCCSYHNDFGYRHKLLVDRLRAMKLNAWEIHQKIFMADIQISLGSIRGQWKIWWLIHFLTSLTLSGPAFSVVRQARGGAQRPGCQKSKLTSTDWN